MREPLPYEPVTFYDTPGVVLNQVLEGRLTPRLLRDAVFDPDRLSPLERQDLGSRMVGEDSSPFLKAAVGVITNPFVWMYLLTSPVGAKAIGSGASLFSLAPKFAPQLKRGMGAFSMLETPLEEARGTAAGEAAMWVNGALRTVKESDGLITEGAEKGLIQAMRQRTGLRVTSLDPSDYRPGSKEAKYLRRFHAAAAADAHEMIEGRQRGVPRGVPVLDVVPEILDTHGRVVRTLEAPGELAGDHAARRLMADRIGQKVIEDRNQEIKDLFYAKGAEGSTFRDRYGGDLQKAINDLGYFRDDIRTVSKEAAPVQEVLFRPSMAEPLDDLGDAYWGWVGAVKKQQQRAWVRAVGNEELWEKTGQHAFEDWKIDNLIGSLQKYKDGLDQPASSLQGLEALIAASSPEFVETLARRASVAMSVPGRYEALRETVKQVLDPSEGWGDTYWRSRNVFRSQPVQAGGKRIYPTNAGTADAATAHEYAPWARAHVQGIDEARLAPLTGKDVEVHMDDLEEFSRHLTNEGAAHLFRARDLAQKAYGNNQQIRMGMRLNYGESARRSHHQTSVLWAMDLAPVPEKLLRADAATLPNVAPELRENAYMTVAGFEQLKRGLDLTTLAPHHKRGVTARVLMNRAVQGELSPARRASLSKNIVTSALSMAGPEYVALYNSQVRAKEMATWFANSWAGRTIEKTGKWGQEFVKDLRVFGDFSTEMGPKSLSRGLASWLYTTHLGLNVSSVILNLTQPLLLAASIGRPGEIAKAYGSAFKQMAGYARRRMALGKAFATDAEKLALIRESFPLTKFVDEDGVARDLVGIGPRFHDLLDQRLGKQAGALSKANEVLMKGFEKSEWFNRLVTGELLRAVHVKRLGKLGDNFADDVERLMFQTQFAAAEMNTPALFRQGPLSNPLARMFMTFPLRSFTNVVKVFPTLGGETSYWRGLFNTVGRGMATSALMYEVGKGLLGADVSRGLFLSASTDLLGGERLLQDGNEWIPVPPIVDIPLDALRSVAAGDMRLMGDTLARTVPGGVALARMMGAAPEAPRGVFGLPGSLQKTFVGWGTPLADGTVPVYSGDGRLISYESPASIVMKGIGADLGTGQDQAQVDSYLVKQREEILAQRHELLRALGANNPRRAQEISSAFLQRYGYPLTVSQEQVRGYLRGQVVGRTERVLDRIDAGARPQMARMVDPSGGETGVRGGLARGDSASQRHPFRQRGIDARTEAEMMRRVQAVGGAATQDTGAFGAYGGYR